MLDGNNRFEVARGLDPVFGNFESFEDGHPPAPCRVLVITDEMRAADAAKQAERAASAVSVWPIKAELNAENLKAPKRKTAPGRMADDRIYVKRERKAKARAKVGPRICQDCPAVLAKYNAKRCPQCAAAARVRATGVKVHRVPCSQGCGRNSYGGVCSPCKAKLERKERRLARAGGFVEREKCATEVCSRLLRSDAMQRRDKLCKRCGMRADNVKKKVKCRQCPALVKPGTKLGLCLGCSAKVRGEKRRLPGDRNSRDRAKRAAARAERPECKAEDCTRRLRSGSARRADGLCGTCGLRKDRARGKSVSGNERKIDMTKVAEMKLCNVASCNTLTRSKSGRCSKDWAPRKGTKMRDGSVWGGIPKKLVVKRKRAELVAVVAAGEFVQLSVPATALDRFWASLPAVDKDRIFTAEISR